MGRRIATRLLYLENFIEIAEILIKKPPREWRQVVSHFVSHLEVYRYKVRRFYFFKPVIILDSNPKRNFFQFGN